jgi:hypothetical protein
VEPCGWGAVRGLRATDVQSNVSVSRSWQLNETYKNYGSAGDFAT